MRPIRYCAKCGEYVDDSYMSIRWTSGNRPILTTEKRLVHIDADGKIIFRNHVPVEE